MPFTAESKPSPCATFHSTCSKMPRSNTFAWNVQCRASDRSASNTKTVTPLKRRITARAYYLTRVLIAPLHPRHRVRELVLVAALGCDVEPVVGGVQDVDAAPVRRVGVEDRAAGVAVERAGARHLGPLGHVGAEVVGRLLLVELALRERHAVIE